MDLLGKSNAIGDGKLVTVAMSIELADSLVVVVTFPFIERKQITKLGVLIFRHVFRGCKGTHLHEGFRVFVVEFCSWQIRVQALRYRCHEFRKELVPLFLGTLWAVRLRKRLDIRLSFPQLPLTALFPITLAKMIACVRDPRLILSTIRRFFILDLEQFTVTIAEGLASCAHLTLPIRSLGGGLQVITMIYQEFEALVFRLLLDVFFDLVQCCLKQCAAIWRRRSCAMSYDTLNRDDAASWWHIVRRGVECARPVWSILTPQM